MVANMGMSDRTKEVFTAGGHGYMIKVHKIKLRGRVKFSTGGKLRKPSGRTGETPVATVKVWMKEVEWIVFPMRCHRRDRIIKRVWKLLF